jgi:hypothetical protein
MNPSILRAHLIGGLKDLGRDCWVTSLALLKVTIPAIIFTKILEELGLIIYIGKALDPLMGLMGLPGELGLVWATAILTTPYIAIGVFAALAPSLQLSGAEMTILGSVILIAHSLPVEVSITKKAGASVLAISLVRLLGALAYGVILHQLCTIFSLWQEPAVMVFKTALGEQTLVHWVVTQGRNICLIIIVIFFVLLAMRLLRAFGILALFERLLSPVLPVFGMSHRAARVTVVGMILGIVYGGALIIKETTAGKMERREVFNSLALMSLSHGLVEDTLVMLAIGAKLGGVLWGRLLFSLVLIFLLVRIIDMFSGKTLTQTSSDG